MRNTLAGRENRVSIIRSEVEGRSRMFGIGSVCWFDMQDISGITGSVSCEEGGSLRQVVAGGCVYCCLFLVFLFTQTRVEWLRVCLLLSVRRWPDCRPSTGLLHLPLLPPPPPLPAAHQVRAGLRRLPACWPSSAESEEMLGVIRAGII